MTKDEAKRLAVQLWYAVPLNRETFVRRVSAALIRADWEATERTVDTILSYLEVAGILLGRGNLAAAIRRAAGGGG